MNLSEKQVRYAALSSFVLIAVASAWGILISAFSWNFDSAAYFSVTMLLLGTLYVYAFGRLEKISSFAQELQNRLLISRVEKISTTEQLTREMTALVVKSRRVMVLNLSDPMHPDKHLAEYFGFLRGYMQTSGCEIESYRRISSVNSFNKCVWILENLRDFQGCSAISDQHFPGSEMMGDWMSFTVFDCEDGLRTVVFKPLQGQLAVSGFLAWDNEIGRFFLNKFEALWARGESERMMLRGGVVKEDVVRSIANGVCEAIKDYGERELAKRRIDELFRAIQDH